jgi:hypothetical protein
VTTTLAIVIAFTEVWLLAHGRALAAAAFALIALPVVFFAARRERR